jgi:hypothetical protein
MKEVVKVRELKMKNNYYKYYEKKEDRTTMRE